MRESATHSLRPRRRQSPASGLTAWQPPPRPSPLRAARRAATAALISSPAVLFLFSAPSAAAGQTPEPEIVIDACVDLGVVRVDLGCPPVTTTPPPTAPPATSPPATPAPTAPPATAPAATAPPTSPNVTAPPAAPPAAPATTAVAPIVGDVVGALPTLPTIPIIDEVIIETPILDCTLTVAVLAATADCNLAVLASLLPGIPPLPPILGLDLNTLLDVPAGVVNAAGVIDTDGGVGGTQGLTGDVCLDAAVLAPTAGACPRAEAIGEPQSLAVVDSCTNVAVLAELPPECVVPDDDGGAGLVDADACIGANVAGVATPGACARADVADDDEIVDVCVDVDLVQSDPSECSPVATPTTVGGGGGTATTAPGGGAGSSTTAVDGAGGGAGDDGTSGGGPGSRPRAVEPATLALTGLAVAGTLGLGALLVGTGAAARLLGREPARR